MINKATDFGLLEAAETGREKVKVFHLQYADDTIFLASAKLSNGRTISAS